MAAQDSGAEGGVCFTGDQPPAVPSITNTFPSDPGITNIAERLDLTTVAPDEPDSTAGNEHDDPYPGGDTPSLGNPLDG